jgi:hypothetical protein
LSYLLTCAYCNTPQGAFKNGTFTYRRKHGEVKLNINGNLGIDFSTKVCYDMVITCYECGGENHLRVDNEGNASFVRKQQFPRQLNSLVIPPSDM